MYISSQSLTEIKKRWFSRNFKISLFVLLIASCVNQTPPALILFDGVSLNGWQSIGDTNWFVEEGVLVGEGADGYLASESVFESYRLILEFKVDSNTNSGVFLHCQDRSKISPMTCFEINIWDEHPRQEYRTGAIVTLKSPLEHIDTLGRWNYYDILVTPEAISVSLNGKKVSSLDLPNKSSGFVALQREKGGRVRFRKMTVQPFAQ